MNKNIKTPEWPVDAKFQFGDLVQRCNMKSGKQPAYRFPGTICGWYVSKGVVGYAVSNIMESGCIQIFPEYMLEDKSP